MVKPDSPPKKRWRPPSKHRKARVGEADVFSWEAAAVLCFVAVAAALAFQHEGLRTRLAHLLWLPRDADELVEEASIRRLERSEFAHDRETAALLRSVQQKPADAVRWFRLGSYMHAARGDRNSAHREFLKAIELAPRYADAYNGLGLVTRDSSLRYNSPQLLPDAREAFEAAVYLAPRTTAVRLNLAMTLTAMRKFDDATQARAILPRNSSARNSARNSLTRRSTPAATGVRRRARPRPVEHARVQRARARRDVRARRRPRRRRAAPTDREAEARQF